MRLEITKDMDLVRNIMVMPDVWDRAAEDGTNQEAFYPITDAFSVWLTCINDDLLQGLILTHMDNSTTLKIHPYLLPEYRTQGHDMMGAFFKWFADEIDTKINKVNVTIPFHNRKLFNFARKVGFKEEGVNRQSYTKNGQVYDQWNLGMTRNEIISWAE